MRFKFVINYLLALVAFLFCSCIREENEPVAIKTITADIVSSKAKAEIEGLNITWSENDKIAVFSSSSSKSEVFSLDSGAGTSRGSFSGKAFLDGGVAKYPYKPKDTYDGEEIHTFIETWRNLNGTVDEESIIMASIVNDDGTTTFYNVIPIIKLQILGKYPLDRIMIIPTTPEARLGGDLTIRFDDGKPHCSLTQKQQYAGMNDFTLNMNVQLDEFEITEFYLGIPPQIYPGGLKIFISSPYGGSTIFIDKDLDLRQPGIYSVEPFTFTPFGKVTPSESLSGIGVPENPFKISSAEDLLRFKIAVNTNTPILSSDINTAYFAKHSWVELIDDIDLSSCCGPDIGNWSPIFDFSGHFDGRGHKITGLFINDETLDGGLFSRVNKNSYIGNLQIEGKVRASSASLLVNNLFNNSTIENVSAYGEVIATSYCAGGICAELFGHCVKCTNYADVKTENPSNYIYAGGIAGDIGFSNQDQYASIEECRNFGHISGCGKNTGAGGIFGRGDTYFKVFDSSNYGDISSDCTAGGICGTYSMGSVENCVNYANIISHATSFESNEKGVGGICGFLTIFGSRNGSLSNCISTASEVRGPANQCFAIAGYFPLSISNCWWLYEDGKGLAESGCRNSSFCLGLTSNQLKGQEHGPLLYKSYTDVVDALNDWAYSHSDSEIKYNGWEYGEDGWPVLSEAPALPPGHGGSYLDIKGRRDIILNTMEQTFSLSVVSSSEVSLTLPWWITIESSKCSNRDGILFCDYELFVPQNKEGYGRIDEIVVSNLDGCVETVSVTQRYTSVSEDFSRNGNVVTLQKASRGAGIDLVFMGDGYIDVDISSGKYLSDMCSGMKAFFSVEPFSSFQDLFNVYYVELVSESNVFGDNVFSTALKGYFGEGTFAAGDNDKVFDICKSVLKRDDLDDVTAIVVMNTHRYAGTCHMYEPFSGDYGLGFSVSYFPLGTAETGTRSFRSLLVHEACGHGFGKLNDEYAYFDYGSIPEYESISIIGLQKYGWFANVDLESDPFRIRWSDFIQNDDYEVEGIGVFEGAATYWTGIYRPTENSIMRYNEGQFNAPSREAIYYKMHKLAFGPSWEYSKEQFLEYDKVNLYGTKAHSVGIAYPEKDFVPLHPPILVR